MINHDGTKLIETKRLILRPFILSDAENMFKNWANDPEVTKFLSWDIHSDLSITKLCVESWVDSYISKETYNWAIILKENPNEVIGSIGAVSVDSYLEQATLGYCLSKKYWNKGIITESLNAIITYLFDCGFMRLSAYHDISNPASGEVMKKCGMQFEGTFRNFVKDNKGDFCNVSQYAILKSDPR